MSAQNISHILIMVFQRNFLPQLFLHLRGFLSAQRRPRCALLLLVVPNSDKVAGEEKGVQEMWSQPGPVSSWSVYGQARRKSPSVGTAAVPLCRDFFVLGTRELLKFRSLDI